jgi:hypothetical protein
MHILVTTFLIFPSLLALLVLSQSVLTKKFVLLTIFFDGTTVLASTPCTWGYVHHPMEPLLPLMFHTRGQEGTHVPWNDENILQVEDANGAVGPSFDAFLFDTDAVGPIVSYQVHRFIPTLLVVEYKISF